MWIILAKLFSTLPIAYCIGYTKLFYLPSILVLSDREDVIQLPVKKAAKKTSNSKAKEVSKKMGGAGVEKPKAPMGKKGK